MISSFSTAASVTLISSFSILTSLYPPERCVQDLVVKLRLVKADEVLIAVRAVELLFEELAALLLLFSAVPSVSSAEESPAVSVAETPPPAPAQAYILVTTASQMGFLPLPDEEDYLFPLTQTLPDGTVTQSVLSMPAPLLAGELAILKGMVQDTGVVTTEDPDVGVSVTLDWHQGMEIPVDF